MGNFRIHYPQNKASSVFNLMLIKKVPWQKFKCHKTLKEICNSHHFYQIFWWWFKTSSRPCWMNPVVNLLSFWSKFFSNTKQYFISNGCTNVVPTFFIYKKIVLKYFKGMIWQQNICVVIEFFYIQLLNKNPCNPHWCVSYLIKICTHKGKQNTE